MEVRSITSTQNRDHLLRDYQNITLEMSGISPKLSTYKTLETKAQELRERIEATGGEITHGEIIRHKTTMVNNVRVRVLIMPNVKALRPKCKFIGCDKMVRTGGRDHTTGKQRLYKYCGEHRRAKKRTELLSLQKIKKSLKKKTK